MGSSVARHTLQAMLLLQVLTTAGFQPAVMSSRRPRTVPTRHGALRAVRAAVTELRTEQELEQALADHELVIVDFATDLCGPCQVLAPKFKHLSELCQPRHAAHAAPFPHRPHRPYRPYVHASPCPHRPRLALASA